MARFWDVGSGCVSIGGIDVRKIHPEQLYSYFSIVFQNVFLFHDTIENNILMGEKKLHPGGAVESKERGPGGQWQNLRGPLKGLDRNRFKTER